MTAPKPNGPEKLRSAILEEAGRQRKEILRRARESADHLLAKAEEEARAAADARLQAAQAEAERRREAIIASASVEINRLALAQTEAVLNSIRDEALELLRREEGFDRRTTLIELAADALKRMSGESCRLRLSRADLQALGPDLAEGIRRRSTRPLLKLEITADPLAKNGDWTLQDEEGRQMWALSLEARLDRLWPELRRQIVAQAGLVPKEETKASRS